MQFQRRGGRGGCHLNETKAEGEEFHLCTEGKGKREEEIHWKEEEEREITLFQEQRKEYMIIHPNIFGRGVEFEITKIRFREVQNFA